MSRRFVGNRGDLLSALGAAPTTPRHRRGAGPKPALKLPRYDPSIELKDYTGSRARPEIQAVLKGHISLETARVQRLQTLMALLNNVDQVTRQLRDEDMAGDPAALQARMAAFLAAREQTVEMWRQAARARQQQQRRSVDDPDTAMVHPAHVPGRRMGPAESEQQWRELDRLVQEQAATFEQLWSRAAAAANPAIFNMPTTARHPTRPKQNSAIIIHLFLLDHIRIGHSSTTQPVPKLRTTTASRSARPRPRNNAKAKAKPNPSPNPNRRPHAAPWVVQKQALAAKFGSEGWSPRRKLSPDAMLHLRALHAANPQLYTTPLLASTFKQSPEAIRRILKSKWLSEASEDAVQARRERWARRHDRIWDVKSELGLRPKRRGDRKVEDASVAGERIESEMWAEDVLRRAREGGGGL
ncbi:hypothetical protein DV737_g4887, partial [Chaetothyriales sp. CBS 132003]